ncbi:MAG TPA: Ig-like domain-containing protein, partial [Aggregatilineales bacterium]|nr:Ig-like domain-containing protein [Aggregatilineales bacterium]
MPGRVNARALIGCASLFLAAVACTAPTSGSVPTAVAQAPSVVFIGPDNNSTIADGATITLAVYASNSAGVSKVDFMVDDTLIGSQIAPQGTPQPSFTAEQTWTAKGSGGQQPQGHFVDAIAYAADGTKFDDAKIALQVVPASSATGSPSGAAPTVAATGTPDTSQAPNAQPGAPTPTLASGPVIPPPGATIVIVTATHTPTPTSAPPILTVRSPTDNLNIRAGDNTAFAIIGAMKNGDTAEIVGRNAAKSWWVIKKGTVRGWVIADPNLSTVSGDTS